MERRRKDKIVGPFLCEKCGKNMISLFGRRDIDGVVQGAGTCISCGPVWSKPVTIPEEVDSETN